MRHNLLVVLAAVLALPPGRARGQMLVSTGSVSGARLYQTNSNDWWIDPSGGRFDLRVNGGATPVMKVDSAGGVTSSSSTLTGTGTATPFALTTSSGVHILSGKLKLEQGAWIEYADGSVVSSSATSTVTGNVLNSTWTTNIPSTSGTNTTFSAAVPGSSITLSGTTSGQVHCYFHGGCDLNTTGAYIFATMLVDGSFASGYSSSKAMMATYQGDSAGAVKNCSFDHLFTGLSNGTHVFSLAFRTGAGTWLLEDPSTTWGNQFACKEDISATSNGNSGVGASTYTTLTTDYSTTGTTLGPCVAGSTITLTSGGTAPLLINLSGVIYNTTGGAQTMVSILQDGSFLENSYTGTSAMAIQRESGGASVSFYPFNISYLTKRIPSGGSHSYCVTYAVTGGTGHLACSPSAGPQGAPCNFQINELTGGNTGTTVTSSTSSSSSGTSVVASSQTVIGNTTFGSSYGPCISTVTMTTGASRVYVYFSGAAYSNGSAADSWWSFLVDGAAPTTQSRGTQMGLEPQSSGYNRGISFSAVTQVLSAGQHSFCLTPWIGSGTGNLTAGSLTTPVFGAFELATANGGGAVNSQVQVYSTPGTFTYAPPAGVTTVWVTAVGAGGGGGADCVGGAGGGGGGAGASVIRSSVAVSGSVTVTVGAGGIGANACAAGNGGGTGVGANGGSSSFGTAVTAAGGNGGGNASGPGGTSGGGMTAGLNGVGDGFGSTGGGGGSGGCSSCNGAAGGADGRFLGGAYGTSGYGGGGGGSSSFGRGGTGESNQTTLATSGGIGAGGGGATTAGAAGTGGNGMVIVEYWQGGGAGASLGSTQTFTGAQTFASSATFGNQTITSTASYASIIKGGYSLLASTHPVAQSAVYFYNIISTNPAGSGSMMYQLRINVAQNASAGILEAQFNGDATANAHVWNMKVEGTGSGDTAATADTSCHLTYTNGINVGDAAVAIMDFAPNPINDRKVQGVTRITHINNTESTAVLVGIIGCRYGNVLVSPINSLKVMTSAGTFTGDISLWGMFIP